MVWQGAGLIYGVGAIAAIAASVVGGAIIGPSGKGAADIAAKAHREQRQPSPAELSAQIALQNRMNAGVKVGALLLVAASVAMASARYM